MLQRGSFPDEVTYKLIIGALVRENKLSNACRVWDQMMERGLTLDRGISEMLINAIQS
jgi:pentatricopeptide repeat protein